LTVSLASRTTGLSKLRGRDYRSVWSGRAGAQDLFPKDNEEVNRWGLMQLSRAALEQGRISPKTAKAIEGLLVLRNLAAHGRAEEVSPKRVREFVALTQGVLYSISTGA
jgi:hypothetical protein